MRLRLRPGCLQLGAVCRPATGMTYSCVRVLVGVGVRKKRIALPFGDQADAVGGPGWVSRKSVLRDFVQRSVARQRPSLEIAAARSASARRPAAVSSSADGA